MDDQDFVFINKVLTSEEDLKFSKFLRERKMKSKASQILRKLKRGKKVIS